MSRIRYKKDRHIIDVIWSDDKLTVIVDGTERVVYPRTQGYNGSVSYVVYIPEKGHNKQLTISKSIVEAVKEGISNGNE